ncbi:hypothetical protein TURU_033668 [Turdus rufiventris]|nr:hypothetical protein TURU_033668 [Turdus rufiventris]
MDPKIPTDPGNSKGFGKSDRFKEFRGIPGIPTDLGMPTDPGIPAHLEILTDLEFWWIPEILTDPGIPTDLRIPRDPGIPMDMGIPMDSRNSDGSCNSDRSGNSNGLKEFRRIQAFRGFAVPEGGVAGGSFALPGFGNRRIRGAVAEAAHGGILRSTWNEKKKKNGKRVGNAGIPGEFGIQGFSWNSQ